MATVKLTWFKEVAFNLPVPGYAIRTDVETTPHVPSATGIGVEVYAVDAPVEAVYANGAYYTIPAGAIRSFPAYEVKQLRDAT